MVEHRVALCPTLAAGDATSQYAGWRKGEQPEPQGIQRKRATCDRSLSRRGQARREAKCL